MKLELIHADTCLPDYWGGHHLAHVQIPAFHKMTLEEIKSAVRSELNEGAIAGHDDLAQLLSDMPAPLHCCDADKDVAHEAAMEAIEALAPVDEATTTFFNELEEPEEDDEHMVYAFFVFREVDGD